MSFKKLLVLGDRIGYFLVLLAGGRSCIPSGLGICQSV